jgi:c-di-GMP-binding flagellar brake protein YcgR
MSNPPDRPRKPPGTPEFVERRRYPRRRAGLELVLSIPAVVDAEVVDLSAGGAMISTPAKLRVGQRCQLRALLDREPFTAVVEVLRVEEEGTRNGREGRHRVGLGFTNLDDNSRRTLQRFVKDDTKSR